MRPTHSLNRNNTLRSNRYWNTPGAPYASNYLARRSEMKESLLSSLTGLVNGWRNGSPRTNEETDNSLILLLPLAAGMALAMIIVLGVSCVRRSRAEPNIPDLSDHCLIVQQLKPLDSSASRVHQTHVIENPLSVEDQTSQSCTSRTAEHHFSAPGSAHSFLLLKPIAKASKLSEPCHATSGHTSNAFHEQHTSSDKWIHCSLPENHCSVACCDNCVCHSHLR